MHISPDTDLLSGAIGGSVLGLSVSMYMYSTGNMTGCSSILNGLLERSRSKWKMAYLHGMLSSGVLLLAFYPQAFGVAAVTLKVPALIAGGMMIGFGTRLGSGCTSGTFKIDYYI